MVTPMNIPLETIAPLKGIFAWKLYKNDDNKTKTFQIRVIRTDI